MYVHGDIYSLPGAPRRSTRSARSAEKPTAVLATGRPQRYRCTDLNSWWDQSSAAFIGRLVLSGTGSEKNISLTSYSQRPVIILASRVQYLGIILLYSSEPQNDTSYTTGPTNNNGTPNPLFSIYYGNLVSVKHSGKGAEFYYAVSCALWSCIQLLSR